MAWTTIADYKAWNPGHGATDALLTSLIAIGTAAMERYMGRTIEQATFTEAVSGSGRDSIRIINAPISSITSIKVIDNDGTAGTAWDSSTYRFDANTGTIWRLPFGPSARFQGDGDGYGWNSLHRTQWTEPVVFPKGHRNIQVIYVGGYDPVPSDLEWSLWMVMDDLLAARGRDSTMQSETLGSYAYTRVAEADDLAGVRKLAMPFKGSVL